MTTLANTARKSLGARLRDSSLGAAAFVAASWAGLTLGGCGTPASSNVVTTMSSAPFSTGRLEPLPPAPSRREGRVFISGHSLTDPPFGPFLESLAQGAGARVRYEEQSLPGSTLKRRTRGDGAAPEWSGYKTGRNRTGENLDVLGELARPKDQSEWAYDTLLVTERHDLLGVFVWDDTLVHLRDFHDRFMQVNPGGSTYFYEPWFSVDDKSKPDDWIRYERAASPVWQCTTTRINLDLAASGRLDRIHNIPAAWALAELVEKVLRQPGAFGFEASDALSVMNQLFADDVHLTPLGAHYVASFSFGVVFGLSSLEAPVPEGLLARQVAPLRTLAWKLAQEAREHRRRLDMAECREYLSSHFIDAYWDYAGQLGREEGLSALWAPVKRFRQKREWKTRYFADGPENPFHDVGKPGR